MKVKWKSSGSEVGGGVEWNRGGVKVKWIIIIIVIIIIIKCIF